MRTKNEFVFACKGSQYIEGALDLLKDVKEYSPIFLEAEPTNPFDEWAIKCLIKRGGLVHIGYIPNTGLCCNVCWYKIEDLNKNCPNCRAGFACFVKGGIARRLHGLRLFERNYTAYVKEVMTSKQDKVTLLIKIQML